MTEEIWKDVVGYEGLYLISNLGRVRRIALTNNKNPDGLMRWRVKDGELIVCLCQDGKQRERGVCRMVWESFGPDPTINILPEDTHFGDERFRAVPGFETRYAVSDYGRLKSLFSGRGTHLGKILGCKVSNKGYLSAVLWDGTKRHYRSVHSLILETFVGPRPSGSQINHRNGIKTDNRLSNLEYSTPKENTDHSIRVLGNRVDGEFNNAAKLTEKQVAEIRYSHRMGASQQTIADHFGVCQAHVSRIVRGKNWK